MKDQLPPFPPSPTQSNKERLTRQQAFDILQKELDSLFNIFIKYIPERWKNPCDNAFKLKKFSWLGRLAVAAWNHAIAENLPPLELRNKEFHFGSQLQELCNAIDALNSARLQHNPYFMQAMPHSSQTMPGTPRKATSSSRNIKVTSIASPTSPQTQPSPPSHKVKKIAVSTARTCLFKLPPHEDILPALSILNDWIKLAKQNPTFSEVEGFVIEWQNKGLNPKSRTRLHENYAILFNTIDQIIIYLNQNHQIQGNEQTALAARNLVLAIDKYKTELTIESNARNQMEKVLTEITSRPTLP